MPVSRTLKPAPLGALATCLWEGRRMPVVAAGPAPTF